jgi:NAD(P)-dependent dehydrogenase (short-subunit alcohol dehydrogenase family)
MISSKMADIGPSTLDGAVNELSANGERVRGEIVDLTDVVAISAAFARVAATGGGLDAIFANAGITAGPGFLSVFSGRVLDGAIENVPHALWDRVLGVKHGVLKTIQSAVPHFKARGGGRMVVTTSRGDDQDLARCRHAYLAAKAAMAHLVRQLALELVQNQV